VFSIAPNSVADKGGVGTDSSNLQTNASIVSLFLSNYIQFLFLMTVMLALRNLKSIFTKENPRFRLLKTEIFQKVLKMNYSV